MDTILTVVFLATGSSVIVDYVPVLVGFGLTEINKKSEMKGGSKIKMKNIEKKSRVIIGLLAMVALFMFMATTFGSSDAVRIGTISIGVLISILLFIESGIVSYVKGSKYKTFTMGDVAVYLGVIAATAIFVYSMSLIPAIGEVLPASIMSFTAINARIIAGFAMVATLVFILTPKFD